MPDLVTRWEALKKGFKDETAKSRPKETQKHIILGTISKPSGVTPILKDIDTAISKKERKPLEQAINKLMVARSTYCSFLMKEQAQFDHGGDVWMEYQKLIKGLEKLEADAGAAAKTVQTEKSPDKKAIDFFSLEGDVKGTMVTVKKLLAPYPALEKKYGLLKKADACIKQAEAYTKAAARTQPKEARAALEAFKVEAKKCADELAKVLNAEKEEKFHKALQSYHDPMKAFAALSRINTQIANLKAMEAGA